MRQILAASSSFLTLREGLGKQQQAHVETGCKPKGTAKMNCI